MNVNCLSKHLICLSLLLVFPGNAMAGAACVIAKNKGHSEAIVWRHSSESAEVALFLAKQKLREQGFKKIFPQVTTTLEHAYVIIVKSDYKSSRGKARTSYGCGFSEESYNEALWAAIRNLQSYAWGWKPDREGYEIIEQTRY